ncbi:MAG: hypothetical protein VCF25_29705 [Candidatus Poribacteria bacterium]
MNTHRLYPFSHQELEITEEEEPDDAAMLTSFLTHPPTTMEQAVQADPTSVPTSTGL